MGQEHNVELLTDESIIPKSSIVRSVRSSLPNEKLLTEQQIVNVRKRFIRDCEKAVEEAIDKHFGRNNWKIPKVFWALLIFFAYDNVIGWFSTPWIFYPLVSIILMIVLLFANGLGGVFAPLFRGTINNVFDKLSIPARI